VSGLVPATTTSLRARLAAAGLDAEQALQALG
jgi:hypothetical protein